MKNIIFIAPPAAGKGTQSALLEQKYHIPHISTGDLLRAAAKEETELGRHIKSQMETGGLIRDDITVALLKERIQKPDCENGYILDGFPRNVEQAKIYDELLKELNRDLGVVIFLDIDYELAKKRIVGRVSCGNCGTVYNTMFDHMKPKVENICDHCGTTLSKRGDDNEETFKKRFDTYFEQTEPLLEYYEKKGVLYRITSGEEKEATLSQIEKVIRG